LMKSLTALVLMKVERGAEDGGREGKSHHGELHGGGVCPRAGGAGQWRLATS